LRRQPNDHNFGSLLMLAVTAGAFLLVTWIATKVEPENVGWWINLAYATRRCESIAKAETFLLRARELHHDNALIEFNLACYAGVTGRFEEARALLRRAIELDKEIRRLALDDEDLQSLWAWISGLE
jgi:tetratricopeptide (TPR) repeat protein